MNFVFGYASLVADHPSGHVARLRGWRRCWGVAMDNTVDLPGYKSYRVRADGSRPAVFVAFLDVEPDPASVVTGLCIPVDAGDLAALDNRERNYDRLDVTGAVDGCATGRVWTYRGSAAGRARLRDGLARRRAVVSRDYLDAVVAAIGAIAPVELDAAWRSPGETGLPIVDLERVEIAP